MKKILFCAGLLALITSCTDDEYASLSHNENAKGITFEVIAPESPTTRGGLDIDEANNTYPYFWHAEVDKINIWSTRTNMGLSPSVSGKENWSDWAVWTGMAKYKATQSKVNGVFTGDDDANVLTFKYEVDGSETAAELKDKTASFIATYPATMTVAEVIAASGDNTDVEEIKLTKLPELTSQDLASSINKIAMYSYTQATKNKSYEAVGEKIGLRFIRPFTAAVFKTKGITEEYSKIFGKLETITLEAKGYTDANQPSNNIPASYLDYGDKADYIVNLKDNADSRFVVNGVEEGDPSFDMVGASNAASAKLELSVNKEWNDSERAFMAMSRVNRSAFKTKSVKEALEVVYTFENITFTEGADKGLETNANWPSPAQEGQVNENLFVPIPALDMAKYPYLVTNESTGDDRALIINSGAYAAAFKNGKVFWNGTEIALTEFNTIISKVELTTTELKTLASFTNLKHVTLALNEVIPANTFKDLALVTINMPNLITIENANAFNAAVLEEVYLPKYKFESTAINEKLLQAGKLTKLDMSGVATMKNVFPAEGFALTGFSYLTNVKVQNGVVLGSSAFKNCTNLATIDGTVNIAEGPSAFEGSGITSITLTNTNIPAGAFKDCSALTEVLDVAGNDLQPTSVGNAAFSGSGIINMDLSKVTGEGIIGEEAFKGCTAFVGTADAKRGINVLYVGAGSISKSAFDGCTSLTYVEFTNATTIADLILANTTGLKEVKFKQVLTSKVGSATMFGTTSGTKLFLNPNQGLAWYEGNDFYPMGNKGTGGAAKVSFQSIVLE